jgi:hypothetical protein
MLPAPIQIIHMKNKIILMAFVATIMTSAASAQFILGGQGSYLSGSPNAGTQIGLGAQAKIKLGNKVAVGGTLRSWFKNESTTTSGSSSVVTGDAMTNLSGMLEIYLGHNIVQPYFGTDAGLYFTNIKVTGSTSGGGSNINTDNRKTYFGIAPKFGIQFNTGFLSPFVQAQYHWLFGGGNTIEIPNLTENPKSYDKFFTLDGGILIQIGKPGGKK